MESILDFALGHTWILIVISFLLLNQLSLLSSKRKLRSDDLEEVDLRTFGGIPKARIGRERSELEQLGFRSFLDYTKLSFNSLVGRNICSVLTSRDQTVFASVEYYRNLSPLMLLVSLIARENVALKCGTVFTSYFDDGTRLLTSSLMKNASLWQPSTRLQTAPSGTTLAEQYQLHLNAIKEYTSRSNSQASVVKSKEDYFRIVNLHSTRTAEHLDAPKTCGAQGSWA